MPDCLAERLADRFVLSTGAMERCYLWNQGHLISESITDQRSGRVWSLRGQGPDCLFPEGIQEGPAGELRLDRRPATTRTPAFLQADVTCRFGGIEVLRRFRLYAECPAIACDLLVRGHATARWQGELAAAGNLANIEDAAALKASASTVPCLERLCLPTPHLRLQCVRFYDVTDRRNNLVETRSILPYRSPTALSGNLLWIQDPLAGAGLFLLKEAPCSDVQLAWPGYDFLCRTGEIQLAGLGLLPEDLAPEDWVRGYGFVTGVAAEGEYGLLSSLRRYQEQVRVHKPGRDSMILLNTWGDRGQDSRIGEAFALGEIEAGARLGVTHFELDDGWQAGQTSNSATAGGSLEGIWARGDFWTVHTKRFPRGLAPVVQASRDAGIELCLWFNPSKDEGYAHWEEDARVLVGFCERYGIRTFKIDGVMIADKRGDRNLRALFERVMEATAGEAVFNLDITAGRRFGYHYMNEYGNLFVENRYTDWNNYYPHYTLRNLWMLSRYVRPQGLQMEFLNCWRNAERYPADDPLAPARVPFAYGFAITMMAQPLAWFEAARLPADAFSIAPLVRTYCEHRDRIHAGQIFPIGREPDGSGWTGFQSLQADAGYFLVFREWNDVPRARLATWALAGSRVRCRAVLGAGRDFEASIPADGSLEFALPEPFSFGLYAYETL